MAAPDGELRGFDRNGDQVDVSKLDEVAGKKQFFRHYAMVAVDAGIAFASEEEVVDPRVPDDPGCHVPVHVEYRYDPQHDQLELRREKVRSRSSIGTASSARATSSPRRSCVSMLHYTTRPRSSHLQAGPT